MKADTEPSGADVVTAMVTMAMNPDSHTARKVSWKFSASVL